jgi:dissimilatory sulfite reductase (desulfoviridin) alpha/beta subunit
MKQSVLAARRQRVIESIAAHAERLGAGTVDLTSGIKGDAEHKQLFMLERIDATLAQAGGQAVASGFTLDEILAIDGLTKSSVAAIKAAFGE